MLTGEGVAKIGDVGLAWVRSQGVGDFEFAQAVSSHAAPEAVLGEECTEKVRSGIGPGPRLSRRRIDQGLSRSEAAERLFLDVQLPSQVLLEDGTTCVTHGARQGMVPGFVRMRARGVNSRGCPRV